MPVASDIALKHGPRRALFAKIAGLEPILWEASSDAPSSSYTAATWGRTRLVCLRRPRDEWSLGYDTASAMVQPSSMSIDLIDIPDPSAPTKRYFSQLFAPGRAASSGVYRCWLTPGASAPSYVEANATSIDTTAGAADFPPSGYAYLGQETFSYSSRSSSGFAGVTKGLFPAVGTANIGMKYRRPDYADKSVTAMMISSVPYSWIGRMVALYMTTYDDVAAQWRSDAITLWVGRITGPISYDPKECSWSLTCEHILSALSQDIAAGMPTMELAGINLLGGVGRTFLASEYREDASSGFATLNEGVITVDADVYTQQTLVNAAVARLNDSANWTAGTRYCYYTASVDPDTPGIRAHNPSATSSVLVTLMPVDQSGVISHAARAMGYFTSISLDLRPGDNGVLQARTPYAAYHPTSPKVNGGYLMMALGSSSRYWTSQGDYGATRAYVEIPNADLDGAGYRASYVAAYSGIWGGTGYDGVAIAETLSERLDIGGYVAQPLDEEPVQVRQVYVPSHVDYSGRARGPFELLLYPLLSTGTSGHNGTYDRLPLQLALGIPEAIVDTASFLAMDAIVAGELARRHRMVTASPTSYMEMLGRECRLFGSVLTWDPARGKLAMRSTVHIGVDTYTITLDDSTRAKRDEWPRVSSSVDSVINEWIISIDHDPGSDKYRRTITIRDSDSIAALKTTRSIEIKHPGIATSSMSAVVEDLAAAYILGHGDRFRYPLPSTTVTLAPHLMGRIAIGDVVLFQSSMVPDPLGSGSMTTSCMALVTDLRWSLDRMIGRASLLLIARYDASARVPWACSAVVDRSALNGGWDAANYRLTLVSYRFAAGGDAKDGATFAAGDKVRIIETSPALLASPLAWSATVASDFETDGAGILTLQSVTLTGWDATREYVVVPADYADAVTRQIALNAWQASTTTAKLASTYDAQRWG